MSLSENEIHVDPEADPSADGGEPRAVGSDEPRSPLARGLPEWDLLPPDRPIARPAPAV